MVSRRNRILPGLVLWAAMVPPLGAEVPAFTEWVWLVSVYDEVLENRATRLTRKVAEPLAIPREQHVTARQWLGIDPWMGSSPPAPDPEGPTSTVSPSACHEAASLELVAIKTRLDGMVAGSFRRWIDAELVEGPDAARGSLDQVVRDLRLLEGARAGAGLLPHTFSREARLAGEEAIEDAVRAWIPARLQPGEPDRGMTAPLERLAGVWDRLTGSVGSTPGSTATSAPAWRLLPAAGPWSEVTEVTTGPATAPRRREFPGGLPDVLEAFKDLESLPLACTLAPGDLGVTVRRRGDRNVLEVTSPSLTRLDAPEAPGGLLFYTMHRAAAPGGPFSTPPGGGYLIDRGAPLVTEATILAGKAGRVAPDRFWLLDPVPGGGPGLDHYRVTEQWCRGTVNEPVGTTAVSHVTWPGEPRLVYHDPVADEERLLESPVRPRFEGQWLVIDLALGWPDQRHDLPGMHVVARRGSWEGHFRSGSRDALADRTRDTRGPGWCRVRVPHSAGATDVTLVMHTPAGRIERRLAVAGAAGASPAPGETTSALEASVRNAQAGTRASIEKLEAELSRVEASITDSTEPPDWPAVHGQYLDRARRIDLEVSLERLKDLSLPLVELDLELHRAQAAGAWAALLEGEKRRFVLLRRGLALESARRAEYDELFTWVASHARSPQDLEHMDEWKREKHGALDSSMTRCRSEIDGLIFRLADGELAALAGDEWALRVIGHHAVGLYGFEAGMASQLILLADRLAILTGDRFEAASLWCAAGELPSKSGAPRPESGPLPAWWPEERSPRAMRAALFPGPDTREAWLVRWLGSPGPRPGSEPR